MNYFENLELENYFLYKCSLNFNDNKIKDIINEIYDLESQGKYHSNSGRTFKINKGFHSVNILEPQYKILEKYDGIKILCSRIQELVTNHFKTDRINFIDNQYGRLKITEIWINILRITDYNIPHNHAHYDISGNFYLKTITKKCCDTDGCLIFLNKSNHHYYLPPDVQKSGSVPTIHPRKNLGILFNSYHKHIVLPHFSDEDRIGVAFNAKYDSEWCYDKIYPVPYWLPLSYDYVIKKEDIDYENNLIKLRFKNGLVIDFNLKNKITGNLEGQILKLRQNHLKNLIETYNIKKNEYFNNKYIRI